MGAFILVLIIMLSPALIMYIIGFSVKKTSPKQPKYYLYSPQYI